jgi:hypothetical protein
VQRVSDSHTDAWKSFIEATLSCPRSSQPTQWWLHTIIGPLRSSYYSFSTYCSGQCDRDHLFRKLTVQILRELGYKCDNTVQRHLSIKFKFHNELNAGATAATWNWQQQNLVNSFPIFPEVVIPIINPTTRTMSSRILASWFNRWWIRRNSSWDTSSRIRWLRYSFQTFQMFSSMIHYLDIYVFNRFSYVTSTCSKIATLRDLVWLLFSSPRVVTRDWTVGRKTTVLGIMYAYACLSKTELVSISAAVLLLPASISLLWNHPRQ